MNKRKLSQIIVGSSLLVLSITAATTFAWFSPSAKVGYNGETNAMPIDGSSSSSYFAYGDGHPEQEGTKHRPYGIKTPRHLYNLAWLQYIGYFDQDDPTKENYGSQYYFELADDIDMTGWTLPPIGTEDHPFISNFEGNGYIISNLNVSNEFTEYNVHPGTVSGWDSTNNKQPHILGLFGVVGNYKSKYDTTNANCVYASSVNSLNDVGITAINVKTSVHDSLMGLAAGYVSGTMSNVAVDVGTINLDKTATDVSGNDTTSYGGHTQNISDYTIVGYTTKKAALRKVTDSIFNIDIQTGQEFNAVEQGDGSQGWGGSINMMTMFQRLDNIRQRATATTTTYTYRTTTTHQANGNTSSANTNYTSGKIYTGTGQNATIGNFNLLNPNDSYMYIAGGKVNVDKYYTYYTHEGRVISNGTNYLNNNDGRIDNGNSITTATRWSFNLGNSLISSEYNDSTYYLRNNNGTLEITNYSVYATSWTIDESDGKYVISNGEYFLNYANNNWTLTRVGLKITDGTNYLNYNGSLGNSTSSTNSSSWFYSVGSSGYIYTTYNNTNYYLRNNNGNLQTSNGTNNASNWNVILDGDKIDIYSGNQHLTYDNGWKLVQDSGSIYYLIRDNNNHYLSYTGSDRAGSSNQASASHLNYGVSTANNSNGQYGFYYIDGSTNRYLGYYSSSWQVQIANDSRALFNMDNNALPDKDNPTLTGKMSAYYSNENATYYIKYNGSDPVWQAVTSNGSDMTIEYHDSRTFTSVLNAVSASFTSPINSSTIGTTDGPDSYLDESRTTISGYEYTAANTTYFPLNVKSDGGNDRNSITNGNYRPTDANTGYVISGSRLTADNTISDGGPALIRVSSYSNSNINNSYSNRTINNSNVRTITAAGDVALTTAYSNPETGLEKYAASKSTLLNVLQNSGNNVYGLHFMGAQISTDHVLKATNVSILGSSYGNPNDSNTKKRTYDLPVNAIDFNLKEKGYINFFSGTYFSRDVTSFFSLHQIFRDTEANGYAILEIKEIAAIYGNQDHGNWSYAYQYTDGTFSKPYRFAGVDNKYELTTATPDPNTPYVENHSLSVVEFANYISNYGYTQLFDTQWITNYTHSSHSMIHTLNQNYLYYFEIPMNNGEYCLGSVQNGTGGYLLYLDIGASASKTQRTMLAEHFLNEISTFEHPTGAAIIPTNTIQGDDPTFDDSNSICLIVEATYKGALTIERDENDVEVTRDASYDDVAKPSYISDTIVSVVDPGGSSIAEECTPLNRVQTETYRVSYYDYKVNYGQTVVTVITDVRTKTNNGAWSSFTRTVKQKTDNGEFVNLTSATQITNKTIVIYKYAGATSSSTGTTWSYADIMNTSSQIYYNGTNTVTASTICSSLTSTILKLYAVVTNETITISQTVDIELVVDDDIATGIYYKFKDYIFIPVVTGGSVTYIVKSIDGTKTFYFIDTGTQLTAVDQTATATPGS